MATKPISCLILEAILKLGISLLEFCGAGIFKAKALCSIDSPRMQGAVIVIFQEGNGVATVSHPWTSQRRKVGVKEEWWLLQRSPE